MIMYLKSAKFRNGYDLHTNHMEAVQTMFVMARNKAKTKLRGTSGGLTSFDNSAWIKDENSAVTGFSAETKVIATNLKKTSADYTKKSFDNNKLWSLFNVVGHEIAHGIEVLTTGKTPLELVNKSHGRKNSAGIETGFPDDFMADVFLEMQKDKTDVEAFFNDPIKTQALAQKLFPLLYPTTGETSPPPE